MLYQFKQNTKKYDKVMAELRAAKVARGCEHCGARPTDHNALDWNHRRPAEKLFNISEGTQYGAAKRAAEIAKCDVLCLDCHDAETKAQHAAGELAAARAARAAGGSGGP